MGILRMALSVSVKLFSHSSSVVVADNASSTSDTAEDNGKCDASGANLGDVNIFANPSSPKRRRTLEPPPDCPYDFQMTLLLQPTSSSGTGTSTSTCDDNRPHLRRLGHISQESFRLFESDTEAKL